MEVKALKSEKSAMNYDNQQRFQYVLREKEELRVAQAGLEDKLQKIELDRESLSLKSK